MIERGKEGSLDGSFLDWGSSTKSTGHSWTLPKNRKRIFLPRQEVQETPVWSLSPGDYLEKEMATHSSVLPWQIPWTEESGGLQSRGLQSETWLSMHPPVNYQSNIESALISLYVSVIGWKQSMGSMVLVQIWFWVWKQSSWGSQSIISPQSETWQVYSQSHYRSQLKVH